MPVDDGFADLMAQAKAGDQAAVRLVLSRFGREVQMMVPHPAAAETPKPV